VGHTFTDLTEICESFCPQIFVLFKVV